MADLHPVFFLTVTATPLHYVSQSEAFSSSAPPSIFPRIPLGNAATSSQQSQLIQAAYDADAVTRLEVWPSEASLPGTADEAWAIRNHTAARLFFHTAAAFPLSEALLIVDVFLYKDSSDATQVRISNCRLSTAACFLWLHSQGTSPSPIQDLQFAHARHQATQDPVVQATMTNVTTVPQQNGDDAGLLLELAWNGTHPWCTGSGSDCTSPFPSWFLRPSSELLKTSNLQVLPQPTPHDIPGGIQSIAAWSGNIQDATTEVLNVPVPINFAVTDIDRDAATITFEGTSLWTINVTANAFDTNYSGGRSPLLLRGSVAWKTVVHVPQDPSLPCTQDFLPSFHATSAWTATGKPLSLSTMATEVLVLGIAEDLDTASPSIDIRGLHGVPTASTTNQALNVATMPGDLQQHSTGVFQFQVPLVMALNHHVALLWSPSPAAISPHVNAYMTGLQNSPSLPSSQFHRIEFRSNALLNVGEAAIAAGLGAMQVHSPLITHSSLNASLQATSLPIQATCLDLHNNATFIALLPLPSDTDVTGLHAMMDGGCSNEVSFRVMVPATRTVMTWWRIPWALLAANLSSASRTVDSIHVVGDTLHVASAFQKANRERLHSSALRLTAAALDLLDDLLPHHSLEATPVSDLFDFQVGLGLPPVTLSIYYTGHPDILHAMGNVALAFQRDVQALQAASISHSLTLMSATPFANDWDAILETNGRLVERTTSIIEDLPFPLQGASSTLPDVPGSSMIPGLGMSMMYFRFPSQLAEALHFYADIGNGETLSLEVAPDPDLEHCVLVQCPFIIQGTYDDSGRVAPRNNRETAASCCFGMKLAPGTPSQAALDAKPVMVWYHIRAARHVTRDQLVTISIQPRTPDNNPVFRDMLACVGMDAASLTRISLTTRAMTSPAPLFPSILGNVPWYELHDGVLDAFQAGRTGNNGTDLAAFPGLEAFFKTVFRPEKPLCNMLSGAAAVTTARQPGTVYLHQGSQPPIVSPLTLPSTTTLKYEVQLAGPALDFLRGKYLFVTLPGSHQDTIHVPTTHTSSIITRQYETPVPLAFGYENAGTNDPMYFLPLRLSVVDTDPLTWPTTQSLDVRYSFEIPAFYHLGSNSMNVLPYGQSLTLESWSSALPNASIPSATVPSPTYVNGHTSFASPVPNYGALDFLTWVSNADTPTERLHIKVQDFVAPAQTPDNVLQHAVLLAPQGETLQAFPPQQFEIKDSLTQGGDLGACLGIPDTLLLDLCNTPSINSKLFEDTAIPNAESQQGFLASSEAASSRTANAVPAWACVVLLEGTYVIELPDIQSGTCMFPDGAAMLQVLSNSKDSMSLSGTLHGFTPGDACLVQLMPRKSLNVGLRLAIDTDREVAFWASPDTALGDIASQVASWEAATTYFNMPEPVLSVDTAAQVITLRIRQPTQPLHEPARPADIITTQQALQIAWETWSRAPPMRGGILLGKYCAAWEFAGKPVTPAEFSAWESGMTSSTIMPVDTLEWLSAVSHLEQGNTGIGVPQFLQDACLSSPGTISLHFTMKQRNTPFDVIPYATALPMDADTPLDHYLGATWNTTTFTAMTSLQGCSWSGEDLHIPDSTCMKSLFAAASPSAAPSVPLDLDVEQATSTAYDPDTNEVTYHIPFRLAFAMKILRHPDKVQQTTNFPYTALTISTPVAAAVECEVILTKTLGDSDITIHAIRETENRVLNTCIQDIGTLTLWETAPNPSSTIMSSTTSSVFESTFRLVDTFSNVAGLLQENPNACTSSTVEMGVPATITQHPAIDPHTTAPEDVSLSKLHNGAALLGVGGAFLVAGGIFFGLSRKSKRRKTA